MDLVLTKWIALKGTSVLASCRAEELSSRFPSVMIRDAAGFTRYLSTEREYQISGGHGFMIPHFCPHCKRIRQNLSFYAIDFFTKICYIDYKLMKI